MKFIELEGKINPKKRQSASYVKRTFAITKEVKSAVLKITALGVYKATLNGEPLDKQVLLPGYTDYKHRVQFQEYDITSRLKTGENELNAVVGDGWYRGSVGIGSKRNCYGTKTMLGCELTMIYADGTFKTIEADESFLVSKDGPLRENDLKVIEVYDATKTPSDFYAAIPSAYKGEVVSQQGEPVLEHERFSPKVLNTPNGETVLDFGQNFAGYVHFRIQNGKTGHQVKLTMGEVLDENGNFTMKNLAAEGASLISGEVGQELVYICKDGKQEYQPYFQLCGFRYVKLDNWCEEVKAENFEGIAVYSDIQSVGHFTCSNDLINQLVKNVKWSQKSNFVDIPGDCPTRERAGWTGDISVFAETACYLTDPRKFLKKWFTDFMLEQWEDGSLPYVVPDGGYAPRARSCCAWSDAIANIATVLYQFYGNKADLEFVYDCVKKFVDYQTERAKKKNPLTRTKNSEHRHYIIERGFHYGEWLEPSRPMYKDFIKDLFYPDTEVTTAWFYQTTRQLSDMAALLGKARDAEKYSSLAEHIKQAYRHEFLTDGGVHSDRQCRYVRPLFMGLVDDEEGKPIAEKLNKMCIENDYKIGTGFHTTYKILSVLCDYGYIDTAYKMLENTKQPGWLYEVTKGATTTWENWNGIDENGVPRDSHNHYAPGAVVAWLFSYCAGIKPLKAGFEELLIQPYVGGTLTFAEAEYHSAKGKIISRWDKTENGYTLSITVPDGIKTKVVFPNGETFDLIGGTHHFNWEA
ncbi:MAG: family 78 glycoside hydrolase catalytic domain [Eubacterium sp.]|nr:family 78 glycoside hydrolase catalytic domain [Eubacterium sp.]